MSERMRERQRERQERDRRRQERGRQRKTDGERDRREREREIETIDSAIYFYALCGRKTRNFYFHYIYHTHTQNVHTHTKCPRACTHNFLLWGNGSQFSSGGDASALGGLSNLRLQTFQLGLKADSATGQPQRNSSHTPLYSSYTLLPISLLSIRKQSRIRPCDDVTLADLPQLAAVARQAG